MKFTTLEEAINAADELHSDTSCSQEETISRLQELREHIDVLIEAVKESCDTEC